MLTVQSPTYRYYLFDLDGTLTDPGIGITNSVMYALEKYGIRVKDRSELYSFIGPPLVESFQRFYGFSPDQAQEAVRYYREYFRAGGIFENEVYDGIPEMLKRLRERGGVAALATSKPEEFALQILEHFQLREFFDHIGAATMDGTVSRKEAVIARLLVQMDLPDHEHIVMIGDRDQDIRGAKANHLKSAGVLWGYGSREELLNAGADHLLQSPEEILSL